jgi:hypothetical protein
MRRHRAFLAIGLGAALVAVAAGWVVAHTHESSPAAQRGSPVDVSRVLPGRFVHVESGEPSTRFLPLGLGPQDGRTLSAQRAYNLLVSGSAKLQPIPASVQAYYGVLTDRSASPRAVHTRVWGFVSTSGCDSTGGGPAAAQRCRLWEFVNARSGHDLGVLSQEVLPN